MYLIGVDIGSTTTKAVVFTESGVVVSIGRRITKLTKQQDLSGKDSLYWKPEDLWGNASEAIKEALSSIKDRKLIKGIAVTGIGSDGVLLDKNGTPLAPLISYMDRKTEKMMDLFKQIIDNETIYEITGSIPWYFHSAFKHMWLKKNEPEMYNKADCWLNVPDFINYKLCGAKVTDYTEASTTLLFDQSRLNWSDEIIIKLGLRREIFPKATFSGSVIGEVGELAAKETGLAAGTPVALGGLDLLCGSFAAGGSVPGSIMAVTGTFESTVATSDKLMINSYGRESNLVSQKSTIKDGYALWGAHYAGGVLEWYKKTFVTESDKDLYAKINELNSVKPGANGLIMIPHLIGSMTPVDDPSARGIFFGISDKTSSLDFVQSIIEGLNYQSLAVIGAQEAAIGRTIDTVTNIGGAGYSGFWMQNKADITGKIIEVPDVAESTALGAALLAGVGSGIYRNFREANEATKSEKKVYHPNNERNEIYKELNKNVVSKIFPQVRELQHTLKDLV